VAKRSLSRFVRLAPNSSELMKPDSKLRSKSMRACWISSLME
jgi:hypothetical protein